jgi:hypothetical protein
VELPDFKAVFPMLPGWASLSFLPFEFMGKAERGDERAGERGTWFFGLA